MATIKAGDYLYCIDGGSGVKAGALYYTLSVKEGEGGCGPLVSVAKRWDGLKEVAVAYASRFKVVDDRGNDIVVLPPPAPPPAPPQPSPHDLPATVYIYRDEDGNLCVEEDAGEVDYEAETVGSYKLDVVGSIESTEVFAFKAA
jgi:hypothetical protein